MEPKSAKVMKRQTVPRDRIGGTGLDWMVPHESRERFGEGVPAQIAGTYRFPRNMQLSPTPNAKTFQIITFILFTNEWFASIIFFHIHPFQYF